MSGSVDDKSSSGSKYGSSKRGSQVAHGVRALADVSAVQLLSTIVAVLESGDGVTLGTTRDGGAISMAMLSGGAVEKFYAASTEEIMMLLEDVEAVAKQ